MGYGELILLCMFYYGLLLLVSAVMLLLLSSELLLWYPPLFMMSGGTYRVRFRLSFLMIYSVLLPSTITELFMILVYFRSLRLPLPLLTTK